MAMLHGVHAGSAARAILDWTHPRAPPHLGAWVLGSASIEKHQPRTCSLHQDLKMWGEIPSARTAFRGITSRTLLPFMMP